MSNPNEPGVQSDLAQLVERVRKALEHYRWNRHGERQTAQAALRDLANLEAGIRTLQAKHETQRHIIEACQWAVQQREEQIRTLTERVGELELALAASRNHTELSEAVIAARQEKCERLEAVRVAIEEYIGKKRRCGFCGHVKRETYELKHAHDCPLVGLQSDTGAEGSVGE